MEYEFNLFRISSGVCPTITLKNHVAADKASKECVKQDLIIHPIENFKEDKDKLEFSTYAFIDCDRVDKIKVSYNADYAHSDVKAGTLTRFYNVKYAGQKLETAWTNDRHKSALITYYFDKMDSRGGAIWEINNDKEVSEYICSLYQNSKEYN